MQFLRSSCHLLCLSLPERLRSTGFLELARCDVAASGWSVIMSSSVLACLALWDDTAASLNKIFLRCFAPSLP